MLSFDTSKVLAGKASLKLYNTEDTMIFPNFTQNIPVGDTYVIASKVLQAKNTKVEYRQDPSKPTSPQT